MKRHILLAGMLLAGMSAFAQTGYMKDIGSVCFLGDLTNGR